MRTQSFLSKIIDRILVDRLRKWNQETQAIDEGLQFAYLGQKKEKLLYKLYDKYREYDYVIAADLTKAFDKVSRVEIIRRLEPLDRQTKSMIKNFIRKRRLRTFQNGNLKVVEDAEGLQGFGLGPLLFVLAMDESLKMLNSRPEEMIVLAYADDVMIMTNSIKESVAKVKFIFGLINLELNETKTKVIQLNNPRKKHSILGMVTVMSTWPEAIIKQLVTKIKLNQQQLAIMSLLTVEQLKIFYNTFLGHCMKTLGPSPWFENKLYKYRVIMLMRVGRMITSKLHHQKTKYRDKFFESLHGLPNPFATYFVEMIMDLWGGDFSEESFPVIGWAPEIRRHWSWTMDWDYITEKTCGSDEWGDVWVVINSAGLVCWRENFGIQIHEHYEPVGVYSNFDKERVLMSLCRRKANSSRKLRILCNEKQKGYNGTKESELVDLLGWTLEKAEMMECKNEGQIESQPLPIDKTKNQIAKKIRQKLEKLEVTDNVNMLKGLMKLIFRRNNLLIFRKSSKYYMRALMKNIKFVECNLKLLIHECDEMMDSVHIQHCPSYRPKSGWQLRRSNCREISKLFQTMRNNIELSKK